MAGEKKKKKVVLVLDVLVKQKLVTVNSVLRNGLTDSLPLKIIDEKS